MQILACNGTVTVSVGLENFLFLGLNLEKQETNQEMR